MKLSTNTKAALLMALSSLFGDLEVAQYRFTKLNNASIYTIKSPNQDIDITLNLNNVDDIDNELYQVVSYLCQQLNIPTPQTSNAKDITPACEAMLERFKQAKNPKNFADAQLLSRAVKAADNLLQKWENSNITTNEGKILNGACSLLRQLTISNCDFKIKNLIEHIEDDIQTYSTKYSQNLAASLGINWIHRPKEPITEEDILNEIRLLTIMSLSSATPFYITNSINHENTSAIKYTFPENSFQDDNFYYLHSRKGLSKDQEKFKKDIYTALFTYFDQDKPITLTSIDDVNALDSKLGERLLRTFKPNRLHALCNVYTENFGIMDRRLQKVLEGVILNLSSIHSSMKEDNSKAKLLLSWENIDFLTRQNYRNIVDNPKNRILFTKTLKTHLNQNPNEEDQKSWHKKYLENFRKKHQSGTPQEDLNDEDLGLDQSDYDPNQDPTPDF